MVAKNSDRHKRWNSIGNDGLIGYIAFKGDKLFLTEDESVFSVTLDLCVCVQRQRRDNCPRPRSFLDANWTIRSRTSLCVWWDKLTRLGPWSMVQIGTRIHEMIMEK